MMKLQFLGADRQVTGSQHLLDADGTCVLVDCGMFQERDFLERNWQPSPVPPREIEAVLLTHAHVDHCGLLPRLVREGFRGRILTSPASADLVDLVLRDSAQIQAEDVSFKAKRHREEGRHPKHPEVPLFTIKDVDRTMPLVEAIPYGRTVGLNNHVRVTFHDAGHILGSAIVDVEVGKGDEMKRVLFSGDLGQWGKPILRDPCLIEQADYIVMESTYGDRDHDARDNVETQLGDIINETIRSGGNVVVPTFAIERAQELMYHISRLIEANRIPSVPVFLDSPMAIAATNIFEKHRECYDDETWELIRSGHQPLRFPGLKMTRSAEESKTINHFASPAVIMAPSGMCTAGRIKHHLARNVSRSNCTILFTGYQVRGTLGRQLLEGSREVRIHGRFWPVHARVAELHGVSGHADRATLMRWLGGFRTPPRRLFLTHGEEQVSLGLAEHIHSQLGWHVAVPEYQQTFTLG